MPLKLIGFIIFIFLIFAFIGFNLDNHTDINIWVNEKGHFQDVSVIIVVFSAYLFGLLSTVPFWFNRSRKKKMEKKTAVKVAENSTPMAAITENPVKKTKKSLFNGKKKTLEEKNS